MNLLFLTPRWFPMHGGVAKSAARLVNSLRDKVSTIHVATLDSTLAPGMTHAALNGNVVVHRMGFLDEMPETLSLLSMLLEALHRKNKFHVVHGFFLYPMGTMAAWIGRKLNIPSVVSIRGNDLHQGVFSEKQFPFVSWTLQNANAVTCNAKEMLAPCKLLAPKAKPSYIPNGVDVLQFRPREKDSMLSSQFQTEGKTCLGFVGELKLKKGAAHLLSCFKHVHERVPSKLFIIGEIRAPERRFVHRFINQNPELTDDVHIVPYVEDSLELCRYYNLLDIILFPSLWDGMPNALLEAMACGKIVIGSMVGGIQDVLAHKKNGFLIPFLELPRLGELCVDVIRLPEKEKEKIRARARETVVQTYTLEKERDAFASLYRRVSKRRS